jgi:UDP-glucose 4-epimerase
VASRPGDVLRLYADTSRAHQLIGFEPKVSFADGVSRLKEWYLSLGKSPEELLEQEIVQNWELIPARHRTEANDS